MHAELRAEHMPRVGYGDQDGWWHGGLPGTAKGGREPPPNRTVAQGSPFVFNITAQPHERVEMTPAVDGAAAYAAVLAAGIALRDAYLASGSYMEPQPNFPHPKGFPIFHKGVWAPFLSNDQ